MKTEVDKLVHRIADPINERLASVTQSKEAFVSAVSQLADRRNQAEAEIAVHYISELKYGMAGSDGSFWSNYIRYTFNNHEILACFLADQRNPFSRSRRCLVLFNKLSLSLLLSVSSDATNLQYQSAKDRALNSLFWAVMIALIMSPYGFILNRLAKCEFFNKQNIFVSTSASCGMLGLLSFITPSLLFILAAVLVIHYEITGNEGRYLSVWGIAVLFDSLSFFYFGFFNWILVSWEGFLCLPRFPSRCCGCCCNSSRYDEGCPPRFMPLLNCCLVKLVLGFYDLGEDTYLEDKKTFEEKYPDRIAIDKYRENFQLEEGSLASIKNSDVHS